MAGKATTEGEVLKAREAVRLLCLAYTQVLGRDGKRSPAQELVWRDMQARGYAKRTTMVPDAKGAVSELRMAQAEGCRIFHLQTQEFIDRALEAGEPTQAKARTE